MVSFIDVLGPDSTGETFTMMTPPKPTSIIKLVSLKIALILK